MSEHRNTPAMELYSELPTLKDCHIRLIRVHPMSELNGSVRCSISTHDLRGADTPEFLALSYTWGPPHYNIQELRKLPSAASFQVDCNGRSINVSDNLYDFLHHCAVQESQYFHGYIWVDALSINQLDFPERSRQVQLMGEIYKTASQIIVWLGLEDHSTESAFSLMKALFEIPANERLKLHPHAVAENHRNALLDAQDWDALASFFRREWFSRAWIIQEVVFARSAVVICGSHSIPWPSMAEISHFIATTSWTSFLRTAAQSASVSGARSSWHNTPTRIRAARDTWLTSANDKLLYALIRARSFNCQDARDKVYSQLGLGEADIFPDYERSVDVAYINTAKYILGHTDNLLLLTCIEGGKFQKIPGLPSWVPDWSVTKYSGLGVTGYPQFHAAGTRPRQYSLVTERKAAEKERQVLRIEVTRVDNIVEASPTKGDLRRNLHSSNFWDLVSGLEPTYTNAQNREDVVWRSLMTNRSSEPPLQRVQYPASPDRLRPSFRDWILWRYVVATEEPSVFPKSSNKSCFPSKTELIDARQRAKEDDAYLANLAHSASLFDLHYSHAMSQRAFRTRKGYFGIGSECLDVGDSLWIVSGCPVPLILRGLPDSKRYTLVGGSYTHGIMNGEFLEHENLKFEMVELE
jgi:hypothetical protein